MHGKILIRRLIHGLEELKMCIKQFVYGGYCSSVIKGRDVHYNTHVGISW